MDEKLINNIWLSEEIIYLLCLMDSISAANCTLRAVFNKVIAEASLNSIRKSK